MSRSTNLWLLRVLGIALVAYVLVTNVRWHDALDLADGKTTLEGRITVIADDAFRVVEREGGEPRIVPLDEVLVHERDDRRVPAVRWGLRTLAGRLAGHLDGVALVLALLCALYVLTAYRWALLLAAANLHLAFSSVVRLTFIGTFFNLAVPGATGGDVVKAWYTALATKRPTRSVITILADRITGMFGLAVLASVVLLFSPAGQGFETARTVALLVLGGGFALAAILLVPTLQKALGLSRLVRKLPFQGMLAEAGATLRLVRERPVALSVCIGIAIVNHAGHAAAVWLLARGLGIEGVNLATALALVPLANILGCVPLVPGGWGVGELSFALFFGQVGVPATEAIGLSVVYRLSMVVLSLPGGLLWMFWRGRPSRANIRESVQEVTDAVHAGEAAVSDVEEPEEEQA